MDLIEFLLDSGADLNARTKWGDTVGHYAACFASYEALKFLLEEGVDLVNENNGKNCFQWAFYAKSMGRQKVSNFNLMEELVRFHAKISGNTIFIFKRR